VAVALLLLLLLLVLVSRPSGRKLPRRVGGLLRR
jgi:hypothetical protein